MKRDRPDAAGIGMQKLNAGFAAAALVALVSAGTFPAGAQDKAQDKVQDSAQDKASFEAQTSAQVATQPGAQAGAQDGAQLCPGNPDALGTSRVLAIDPDQLQRVGRMQYPDSLPLADKEVVLTFDDGPLPPYSNQILDILAAQCVKATYFMVGTMARAYPQVVRRVYEAGHTIGTHSDNHPMHFSRLPIEKLRQEIDGGIADVSAALGDRKYLAPFFRIPGLDRSDTVDSELAARSLTVFSSDTVADDWHRRISPSQITALALKRLEARGKGILLLHDIHATTVAALPGVVEGAQGQRLPHRSGGAVAGLPDRHGGETQHPDAGFRGAHGAQYRRHRAAARLAAAAAATGRQFHAGRRCLAGARRVRVRTGIGRIRRQCRRALAGIAGSGIAGTGRKEEHQRFPFEPPRACGGS